MTMFAPWRRRDNAGLRRIDCCGIISIRLTPRSWSRRQQK